MRRQSLPRGVLTSIAGLRTRWSGALRRMYELVVESPKLLGGLRGSLKELSNRPRVSIAARRLALRLGIAFVGAGALMLALAYLSVGQNEFGLAGFLGALGIGVNGFAIALWRAVARR